MERQSWIIRIPDNLVGPLGMGLRQAESGLPKILCRLKKTKRKFRRRNENPTDRWECQNRLFRQNFETDQLASGSCHLFLMQDSVLVPGDSFGTQVKTLWDSQKSCMELLFLRLPSCIAPINFVRIKRFRNRIEMVSIFTGNYSVSIYRSEIIDFFNNPAPNPNINLKRWKNTVLRLRLLIN